MDPSVAAAVLAASLLHASWHALVKSSGDGVIALAGVNLVSGAAALYRAWNDIGISRPDFQDIILARRQAPFD